MAQAIQNSIPQWTGERLVTDVSNETKFEHLHRYALAVSLASGMTVLDIASGEGYGSNLLAGVAAKVVGVDIDSQTVAHAQGKYGRDNLVFLHGSAIRIPCEDNTFDRVISFETIEHIEEHEAMILEIKRVLKPDGIAVISSPEKKYYSDAAGFKNEFHKKELYLAEFEALLARHFANRRMLFQKMTYCSLIFSPGGQADPFTAYGGDFGKVAAEPAGGFPYNIAICSDGAVPSPGSSIFNAEDALRQIRIERTRLLNSKTYRLGDSIVRPFRALRALFGSRR
ncbi:MAG TPA: class I SAM-dependent methyltransferase [Chthoniobacteraceae bacterium]|jgi:ubiquinone/menaquinone biosynthesis C-methylase UbiE|nr:class I SAM-dependent methyltransferase [Chthoniobacteraceae bacterium]